MQGVHGEGEERREGRKRWGGEEGGGRMRRVPDCLPEHFYAEHVSQDLFRLAVKVRVDERHVIVGGDAVAEGAEALHERNSEAAFWLHPKKTRQDTAHLLHSLHNHLVGERVAYVGQLLVGSRAGQDEPLAVADAQAANDAAAGYAAAGGEGGRGGGGGFVARPALTWSFTHDTIHALHLARNTGMWSASSASNTE